LRDGDPATEPGGLGLINADSAMDCRISAMLDQASLDACGTDRWVKPAAQNLTS